MLEIVSVTVFTLDYVARAISASTTTGLMRYLWSFYGMVDLLSVLPFFVGLSSFGGVASLSPALLPTVVSCRVSDGSHSCLFGGWNGDNLAWFFVWSIVLSFPPHTCLFLFFAEVIQGLF